MTQDTLSEAEYDAITDAAAHWCMRVHAADCTEEERRAFKQWHDAHPLHAFEYEAMLEIWDVAEHLPRPESPSVVTPRPTSSRSWRQFAVAAGVFALALPLAAYTGWNLGWLPNSYQHFAATDNVRQVTLSDGSQLELNLNTDLTFSNYKDERRVTLKKGEAFFTVSHDMAHPFVVRAGEGRIRVTGTRFNVWMYQDQVRVNLIEGSVLVTSNRSLPGDGLRLGPSMQARYKQGDYMPQISQTYADDSSLAWRSGKLVLDNLALSDALPLINRYLSNPLELADTHTGSIRVGGIYNIKELSNLANSLPKALPVYLSRNKEGNPVINSIPQQPPKS
ncbi:peptide ABC transporter substrate-binding protein [Pseudomonas fluorescens]|jgi:transmembrane sensor|uniref:Peptide ABC transporter substrate-binding protein n=2 Tax=Pseudomonas TaxID=286 RepID=A0A423NSV6_PSEFL|nr:MULTISPECIES: FecR family protein [Pseudomonas fluorescens group]ROO01358.1 peptide ABC transporter substrate-binding protein [Pseudomonas fluorescens]TKJ87340.1 peptide ABC transporter substrate-binding protein [Pseudomonas koreensis]